MKQLLILSGKGGTGKTTTAAAFIAFSKGRAFADCDVDAPNLHLVMDFKNEPEQSTFLGAQKAWIDTAKCIGCGKCQSSCRFDSIVINGDVCAVNELSCEGCAVCTVVCPTGAVAMKDDVAGDMMRYKDERVFSTAKLKMGRGNSGKLVTAVKKSLVEHANAEFSIIDGSPGIGCPVIASISGVNMVLIVAEPSLSGISDMERILRTCKGFNTKAAVCINKYDSCLEKADAIEAFCNENKIPFVGRIPYDRAIPDAINDGKSIADVECPAGIALRKVYNQVLSLMDIK